MSDLQRDNIELHLELIKYKRICDILIKDSKNQPSIKQLHNTISQDMFYIAEKHKLYGDIAQRDMEMFKDLHEISNRLRELIGSIK